MKRNLISALVLICSIAVAQSATHGKGKGEKASSKGEDYKVWAPDQLNWAAAPALLPAGAQLAVVEGDPTKPGEFTMRLKMPDGYKIPPHFHPRTEHVTMISGSFLVGMGDSFDESKMSALPVGTFAWIKPGHHHFAMAKGETVIQLHGNGPWSLTYVNPKDDPRHKK